MDNFISLIFISFFIHQCIIVAEQKSDQLTMDVEKPLDVQKPEKGLFYDVPKSKRVDIRFVSEVYFSL